MPVYEFQCNQCNKEFEVLTQYDESGKYPKVECPECGSKKKTKKMTLCSFIFAQPEGTDKWRNSHDYRFKHKLPKAQEERRAAEAHAKQSDPYNKIDDINSGKYFGEVK